jgi:hypothetical protein
MGFQRTLAEYGERYRVRVNRDECGDSIVRGKFGYIYEHDAQLLGIAFVAPPDKLRLDRTLRARRHRAVAAGFILHQEGDCEAILLFDPSDRKQALLASQLIHVNKIRKAAKPTDAQLRARALFSRQARSGRPCLEQNTSASSEARG